ncbi:hypothetical protein [Halostagnicola sp. A56]|uniref:hypothetical protein n=1 Tax=Halostagnicola sp. A56 TaxID=1495067 RepID=UPI0012E2DDA9|nr:hypothetical protein [Halostagnicola sp. A56]
MTDSLDSRHVPSRSSGSGSPVTLRTQASGGRRHHKKVKSAVFSSVCTGIDHN